MKADLHVHTCLSPCADLLMIPPVVERASGDIQILGIVDHNSAKNVPAFLKMKKLVVPGIEIQTVEDVHVLGFFPDIESALKVTAIVYEHLPSVKHDHEKMGYQLFVDEEGNYTGYEDVPLGFPSDFTLSQAVELIRSCGGIPAYAHVEKRFGVLYQLGFFPDLEVLVAEVVSREGKEDALKKNLKVIVTSDAHFPSDIGRRYIEIFGAPHSPEEVLKKILNNEYTLGGVLNW